MWVEVAVPKIVHSATCATHDDGTRIEEKTCSDHGRDGRDWVRERSSEYRAEHTREEEVICTDWFVETYKLSVRDPRAG